MGRYRKVNNNRKNRRIMNVKKIYSVLALSLTLATTATVPSVNAEDVYNIQCGWYQGYAKTQVEWQPWAYETAQAVYNSMTISSVGSRLKAEYITRPNDVGPARIIWLVARVTGRDGHKVALTQLRFGESSSPIGLLDNNYSVPQNAVYGLTALGINWKDGKPRLGDSMLMTGTSGDTLVDEIIFIGMQTRYFTGSVDDTDKYIATFQNSDFILKGWFRVVGSSGETLGLGQKTLYYWGGPTPARLKVYNLNGTVDLNLTAGPDNTWTILSSDKVQNGVWSPDATLNGGTDIFLPVGQGKKFFRAVLE